MKEPYMHVVNEFIITGAVSKSLKNCKSQSFSSNQNSIKIATYRLVGIFPNDSDFFEK